MHQPHLNLELPGSKTQAIIIKRKTSRDSDKILNVQLELVLSTNDKKEVNLEE